jgi:hypothetical protein
MISNVCALILASSRVSYNHSSSVQKKHFAFLNAGNSLAVDVISKFYSLNGIKCFIATDIDRLLHYKAFSNVSILNIESFQSVTESLSASLRELSSYDELIVNPIQSIPTLLTDVGQIVLSDKEYRKEDWTSLYFDDNNVVHFYFKKHLASYGKKSYPFTGRFHCLRNDLHDVISKTLPGELDDLGYLAYKLFAFKKYSFVFDKWLDLTHNDIKIESKMNQISSRSFHSLKYDAIGKTITKKMESVSSVLNISDYYDLLSAQTSLYFPALISTSLAKDFPSCTFEFIPYPTLSELLLHENIGTIAWENIVLQLKHVYDLMLDTPIPASNSLSTNFCSTKLTKRRQFLVDSFSQPRFSAVMSIYNNSFTVNGIPFPPLNDTYELLLQSLIALESKAPELGFSHGDFCFNNILADPSSGVVKLIDPRVSLHDGLPLGVLPCFYDLSKINHSITYLYDSIVNGLFQLQATGPLSYHLNIFVPDSHSMIKNVFDDVFSNIFSDDSVDLLTANLFLSMLPLHSDSPTRMLAFSFVGSSILSYPDISGLHPSFK